MAGAEHRHQLVAEFFVAHRLAVLVAGAQQQREDVVALLVAGFGPPHPDLLEDEFVQRFARADEPRPRAGRAEVAAQHREGGDDADAAGEIVDQPLEAPQPALVVDAEDGAHDHRQGDPLGVRSQRERLADRPSLHLPPGHRHHQLAVALDPLAVERRQQQLALTHVRLVVEGEDRVRPQRGLQHRRVRLAGVEDGGGAGEDALDEVGAGDVNDPAEEGEADREDVAVAALLAAEETERVARVAEALDQRRRLRPRRLRHQKTIVRSPSRRTRSSRWAITARARTRRSMSRPIRIMSATSSR